MNKADSICQGDSLMIGGVWQSTSGTYQEVFTAQNGCDSICNISLSILPIVTSSKTENICNGDSLFLAGAWQTTRGTYCDTLVSANGCDSICCTTLNILQNSLTTTTDSICQGDSLFVGRRLANGQWALLRYNHFKQWLQWHNLH
ncbi:MAG: hypothetical protein U5L96_07140 [Owenweeksia sp.]|nr:hypothetical protein [Owenweeksia sp.]